MRRLTWLALLALAGCAADEDGHIYRVPSSSMEPTLHCAQPAVGCLAKQKDRVYAVPYGDDDPKRGDIVVFHTPRRAQFECGASGLFIKRVVGLPEERWSERGGTIVINDKPLAEPYIRPERRDQMDFKGGRIPAARYLLLGDNRVASCDSRIWGLVPRRNIVGKVTWIKRGSKRIHLR